MSLDVSCGLSTVSLNDRYVKESGTVLVTGVQALVRLALEQARRDDRAGSDTGGFVTGYPGSPLAGLDIELGRREKLLVEHGIVHSPGLNEELAATAVAGSQLSMLQPDRTKDGVFAIWYGKAPGLDRASDAIRHGNLMGTSPAGGVLVCVGDDPQAKSSSVPSTSEPSLYSLGLPILAPADPQEIVDLGLHGFALSRCSGLWVGMRIPASVADASQTIEVGQNRVDPQWPELVVDGLPFTHQVSAQLLGAKLIELESSLYGPRLEKARRYSALNGLNSATARGDHDTLGVVAAGPAYLAVLHALEKMGLTPRDLPRAGIRLFKVSMPYPLDPGAVREFAEGLSEIIVVEDKRAFLETFIKDSLYGVVNAPDVWGKFDGFNKPLLPQTGEIDADTVGRALAPRVMAHHDEPSVREFLQRPAPPAPKALPLVRGAYFCSGCPHNTSVKVPEGAYVGSGSGCHGLAIQMGQRQVGTVVGRFQMGGEGAMWNGMSHFVTTEHFVQNLGDGNVGPLGVAGHPRGRGRPGRHHLQAAGQLGGRHDRWTAHCWRTLGGRLGRRLLAEGVTQIIVTTDKADHHYPGLPAECTCGPGRGSWKLKGVWPKSAVSRFSCTIKSAPPNCAVSARGASPHTHDRVYVNTRACEDCGDCGARSNCLSVHSLATPFGPKTQIHQESCNFDYSCLQGDCPALVTVSAPAQARPGRAGSPMRRTSRRRCRLGQDVSLRLTGIGGTGVVTVSQMIAMAAHFEGLRVRGLDQTGIAQKGGAVVSDLRISREEIPAPIAWAMKSAISTWLRPARERRATKPGCGIARTNSRGRCPPHACRPAARWLTAPSPRPPSTPSESGSTRAVEARENVWLDAQSLAESGLGSDTYANVLLLGVAFQPARCPSCRGAGTGDPT